MANKTIETEKEGSKELAVGYLHTTNFPELLRKLNLSLIVTTYQAQRILTFSPSGPEKLFMLMRIFERPTGLAVNGGKLALGSKNKVWIFQAPAALRDAEGNKQPHDICFIPRRAYVTGDISVHELAFINDELIALNTRFSCLCTPSDSFSFTPGWRPPFITELAPEDRCHLNGFAIDERGIRYLSALGETNTKEGWRANKASGGIIMEYPSGKVICRGLSMPHSPRLYGGQLWILNSGCGELQVVDPATGTRRTIATMPGFLRGLVIRDNIAFVGLCKGREKKTFGDLPLEKIRSELECAIYAIDIRSGATVGFIKFTKGIEELFDIQVLPGLLNPHVIGFEEDTINGMFVLP